MNVTLSAWLGCRFYLKHENHTPTTAFKVRGGINLVGRLPEDVRRRGGFKPNRHEHDVPLAEIAPERVIGGIAVRDALARIDASGIERLPPRTGQ